jgi:hypothetical protein
VRVPSTSYLSTLDFFIKYHPSSNRPKHHSSLHLLLEKPQDILTVVMSSAVASQAGQVLREIFKIPSRAREQVGQSWRTRFWQTGTSLIYYINSITFVDKRLTNPQNDQRKKSSSPRSTSISQSGSPALPAPTLPRMRVLWL